ncbi:hypothetical protein Mlute_02609 [Meiothermus luteus]|jgi:branched-subunit amino acid ABC-type transport system permease component|uniref:Uncharacterized protein n=1 Tax=Meiothermus luteus TaxID=2026184 RepID=A0A399EG77_9DEIN|nr:hypothetical protein [Meiothermus luteus]RIH82070.1 hypothetical protein Mlute_02609 [Meiothermus luteus]RMH53551.1 MAG: hypothetical protein D6684_12300 [Deinococcota bacterium]
MKVHPQEIAMVGAIAWVLTLVVQIPKMGFFGALLLGLPLAVLAAGAYGLLMPWVLRWAARGLQKENLPPSRGKEEGPPSDGPAARR